jgi:hypothetical protein
VITVFLFGVIKKFWKHIMMIANTMNVINAIKVFT